ncbi:UBC-like protein [Trichoderma longibrachiatum]|uniref:E2 ubiquitin-conjugating enzyme n=1 Tax=Trichoderma longibrachiatum ATCC 18648 TaxID=983965 RepID=A0A2T4CBQ1_TRILO|nr:UBC-like protein [Trichoderma longibrachiatum ATCC 18648]
MSTKRISKEFAEVSQSPPPGFTITLPPSASLHTWHIVLSPPPSTPFHPGRFGIVLTLPTDYPFKPPVVKFVTRLYHPNVTNDSLGNVCLGVLKPENWKPSTKIAAVLEALMNLMIEPQPDDPLEERIADEYRNDRPAWEAKAREMVNRYALEEPVFPAS